MQTSQTIASPNSDLSPHASPTVKTSPTARDSFYDLLDVIQRVNDTIAPVWPLKDYVAVNPYLGLADRPFLNARRFLQVFSDCETLMPMAYYRAKFQKKHFGVADVELALAELREEGLDGAVELSTDKVLELFAPQTDNGITKDSETTRDSRCFETLSETLDRYSKSEWTGIIRDEVGRFLAAHYDEGQAAWQSPWKDLSLFQAWRSAATVDCRIEILGLDGFRNFVAELPHTPAAAIAQMLRKLNVPERLWEAFLLCQLFTMPGWAAWTKYQANEAEKRGEGVSELSALVAIRLAYDVALARQEDFSVDWTSVADYRSEVLTMPTSEYEPDALPRYVLLRASEIAYRNKLVGKLEAGVRRHTRQPVLGQWTDELKSRKLAQMVFCIDVRSEVLRRSLEMVSDDVETFGFAGFFGLPIEYVPIGESSGSNQVPALLSPSITVQEGLESADSNATGNLADRRSLKRLVAKAWKSFQSSAVSCFGFVETSGLLYGAKLFGRSLPEIADGDSNVNQRPGPVLCGLHQQGLTTSAQTDLAESMLRGIGITDGFARLVVFCGHGSQVENNPLQAGLDCGACGGHSGEPNARLAAKLLNQKSIRQKLAERGIEIPGDTQFVAAVHNTTNDRLEFFNEDQLPETHVKDLQHLVDSVDEASSWTRMERLPRLATTDDSAPFRRAADWSEIRPEWGLAGNAAFVVAPRSITKSVSLNGRSFLHSYDHNRDPEFSVLEQIMTAPMVVAHWINMQYYASTVDDQHFGSGDKTIHNVVGRFGIHSGNGGDLMTGLPWQSVHDGTDYQHEPLRLMAVIAAPREAIASIISRHEVLENLVSNDWLHVVAIDDGSFFRYTAGHQGRE